MVLLNSVARLENSKTTRNFPKTTSLATRQEIAQKDQFSDQDLSTTSKTTRKYWHATRNFCSREKIEKYFWLTLPKTGHFAPIFAKILSEAENAQDCMPGRSRPGQNFADQATLKTPRIVANAQVWPSWLRLSKAETRARKIASVVKQYVRFLAQNRETLLPISAAT